MGEKRGANRVLVGKPDGKGLLGIPRRRWEDNILKWIFRKWDGKAWTGLFWLRIGGRWWTPDGDETWVSVTCGGFLDFALRPGLLKAVRVIVVWQFHLLCKYFISDPEFPRQMSAVWSFIKDYSPPCLVFMYPIF
jgi:hypothetical protein